MTDKYSVPFYIDIGNITDPATLIFLGFEGLISDNAFQTAVRDGEVLCFWAIGPRAVSRLNGK